MKGPYKECELSKFLFSSKVVWKGSKEMGIAQAKSKSNKIIVVANYDPPGNFVGRYRENVAPPTS